MANFGPSKTWTDGEILSHTDLNAALLDIINNVTNNNIDADNIDETDDYTWSGANSFTGGHSITVLSNAAASIVTGTTLEWDPGDGGQMTDNSSGISLDFKLPDAADNQDTFASIAAICLDDTSTSEDGELSFRVATAGTNTEQMTLSSTALTVTPAITASGGITGSVTSSNATITGGTITGITDIAIADGGTGASTAAAARTNLGLEIGVDVQAYDAELQALSGLTPTDGNIIVGNGSTFVTESGATARTSLGLGSIATQSASAVSITGGSLTGMTSYSGGTISGTTGTFSGDLTVDTSTLKVDSSNNRVGVLCTNPNYPFTVQTASNHRFFIRDSSTSAGSEIQLQAGNDADTATTNLKFSASRYFLENGSLGLGLAPTATMHSNNSKYLELPNNVFRWSRSTGSYQSSNFYYDSSDAGVFAANGYGLVHSQNTSGGAYYWNITTASNSSGAGATASLSTKMYLDNTGLGIGTSSPQVDFHVDNASTNGVARISTSHSTSYAQLQLVNQSGNYWYQTIVNGDNSYRLYNGSDRLTLTSAGLLGIGTSSPAAGLHLSDGTAYGAPQNASRKATLIVSAGTEGSADLQFLNANYSHIFFGDSADANVGVLLYDHTNDSMQFHTNGAERARITSTGSAIFNATSADGASVVISNSIASTYGLSIYDDANSGWIQRFYNNSAVISGSITRSGTSVAYNTSSDYRLKENVVGITDGITRIKSLKPSRFNFIADADRTVDGFVAHEVSDIVPEAISGAKDAVDEEGNPEYQGIDQSKLVPLLTAALQEAITKIETLETKVAALEAA